MPPSLNQESAKKFETGPDQVETRSRPDRTHTIRLQDTKADDKSTPCGANGSKHTQRVNLNMLEPSIELQGLASETQREEDAKEKDAPMAKWSEGYSQHGRRQAGMADSAGTLSREQRRRMLGVCQM